MPMSKAVTVEKTSKLSFRHLENWESNSERKLAKIRTIWLWLLAVSPVPGGSWSSSPILLDSSDFWEVEIWWNMKIENISRGLKKRTFGEFEMNYDVLAFEPVPSGKSHRYLLEITSRGSIFFYSPSWPLIGIWGPSWCPELLSGHSPLHAPRDTLSGQSSHPEYRTRLPQTF